MAEINTMEKMNSSQLVELSCNLYGEMEKLYLQLNNIQLNNPEKVNPLLRKLEEVKEKIFQVDSRISTEIQSITVLPETLCKQIATRKDKIRQLLKLNQNMLASTMRYKMFIQSELMNLRKNRHAVSGYSALQQYSKGKQKIKGSC